jgi:hypothetical protein
VPAPDRVRHYAWTLLAPRLHADGFRLEDSAFLAGLVQVSGGRGFSQLRARLLADLAQRTETAVARRDAPLGHLVVLRRLQAEDAARAGEDPVVAVARSLGRCFLGQIPLAYTQQLLDGWQSDLWTRGNLTRLRVLLCEAAFDTGFEVSTLLDAAGTASVLRGTLDTAHREHLAALRLLWSLREKRPWEEWSRARTVFEAARDPRWTRLLARYPDVLLIQEEPDWPALATGSGEFEPVRILLCSRGVVLQDVLFTGDPPIVDVVNRVNNTEVTFVPHRFRARSRVDALVACMQSWFRFASQDFLPQLPEVLSWQPPDSTARLRAWGAVPCPQCRHLLLPRVGEVGLSLTGEMPSKTIGL